MSTPFPTDGVSLQDERHIETLPAGEAGRNEISAPRRRTRYVETLLAPFDRLLDAIEQHGIRVETPNGPRAALGEHLSPRRTDFRPFLPPLPDQDDPGEPDRNVFYAVLEQALYDLVIEPEEYNPVRACPRHGDVQRGTTTRDETMRRVVSEAHEPVGAFELYAALSTGLGICRRSAETAVATAKNRGLVTTSWNGENGSRSSYVATDAGRAFLEPAARPLTYRACEEDWWFGPAYEDPDSLPFEEICEALFLPIADVREIARRAVRVRDGILAKEAA